MNSSKKDLLLITPPFTQLNTPYPATAFLKGFLNGCDYKVAQADLGIETLLLNFTADGLRRIFNYAKLTSPKLSVRAKRMVTLKNEYIDNVEAAIKFLQGKDNTLAHRIVNGMLPQGDRFAAMPDTEWLFGTVGSYDLAKFIATLFIEDIGDFITETVDPNFGFSRYAEHIGLGEKKFSDIEAALQSNSPITAVMLQILETYILKYSPRIIGFSVPFPGNLYGALKSAQFVKENHSEIILVLGGGFANTELRELAEPRLFNYVDYVCIDDGERALLNLLDYVFEKKGKDELVRTFLIENSRVKFINNQQYIDFTHSEIGTPDYEGLTLNDYISVLEMPNPMHRLWSDGRWNKLALAHGCYWHKCSFCDTSLDYIKRYSKTDASTLCDRIEKIIEQTSTTGFHFVDEAAPPLVLRDLATELIKRRIKISWWTNIRFEKTFSADLCKLLATSGCIAITGGLEVASDRLLTLMQKGVSIKQVTIAADNFQKAGIMVHAYLMYGFPTQTAQETIDALEVVRQLFENKLLQSAFWHRFVMTVHSPVGLNPEKYKVTEISSGRSSFANNDSPHKDPTGCNHGDYSYGLKKALYNYMHEMCFDFHLSEWFDFRVPKTRIYSHLISDILQKRKDKIDFRQ